MNSGSKLNGWVCLGISLGALCYVASLVLMMATLYLSEADQQDSKQAAMITPDIERILERRQAAYKEAQDLVEQELEEKEEQIKVLRARVEDGMLLSRTIEVTSTSQGYWLAEPDLMLGVSNLTGGSLRVSFGDRFEGIRIAERKEIALEDKNCFLVLTESTRGSAKFWFGCRDQASAPETYASHVKFRS